MLDNIHRSYSSLLDREVGRREFLFIVLSAVISVVGIKSILDNLSLIPGGHTKNEKNGFGSGGYGI
jgi:hypothetical protein